eukprot:GHRQ01021952.1.p1 GENE.GHRQ01021952.1~~GHRQ01021952.1.p1  ORF type:complete len:141 (+),score=0.86 GHRQ01021952.1:984-1406(+)
MATFTCNAISKFGLRQVEWDASMSGTFGRQSQHDCTYWSTPDHPLSLRRPSLAGTRVLPHLHQAAVRVHALPGADALGHNAAARVLAHVHHLGACVCLLHVVGERHAVKLAHAVVALEHDTGVLPGDRAAGLDLHQITCA